MPAIAVCVPVYRAHGEPNIAGLARDLRPALDGLDGELVVALNGISAVDAGLPDGVRFIDLGVNRGVAPGWNAAARAAPACDVVVFANDDVSLGPGSLAMLHRALALNPQAGIVGPVGSRFDFRNGTHVAWAQTEDRPPGELVACDVVSGFLFALRRADFDAVGGFDDAYAPATMEEIDLNVAVHLELGLGSYVVAGVPHAHRFAVSATPAWRRISHNGRRELLFTVHRRNRRHFFAKWAGRV
ncbi:MAG: glycosyltransferase family 2 protein [Solirubrobacteraceae bacterium]